MEPARADTQTARGPFASLIWGDPSSPLVLALHGFPDEASTFDQLAPLLVQRGFRVMAPYLRGFAPSTTEGPFGAESLARDLAAILLALGNPPVVLLVHDMGAQAAYALFDLEERNRLRIKGLCTLSLPHPGAVVQNMRRSFRQMRMSRYVFWFQTRALADWSVRRHHFREIDRLWRRWSPRLPASAERMKRVKAALAGGWPAPLRHYREGGFGGGSLGCIDVPWLHLIGADDGCTLPEMRAGQERYAGGRHQSHVLSGIGHFIQLEAPEAIASAMDDFPLRPTWIGAADVATPGSPSPA